ncbi:MAG: DUF2141 domain-containing protein [Deltaproteobacteria bacterium]|nr:DUF2141 domain-containing protein [Deltaproteobacteria bacterium]NND27728.1 DUF2141 domain-containing protein [Myxococcales bacterium]MBT8466182.1 DUF2141 domain-containing protein [Deltaproteobacteria bacterium]MBT8480036.1 DUF2141 domain-containing protein [Deltaproteobacteria bacterium]NNK06635.1 DUF2141 domain-containing protein [Myxococcales bacterium]
MAGTKMAGATCVAIALIGSLLWNPSSNAQVDTDPAAKNILTLEITGVREPAGRMACALFWQNKGFPRKHRRALRRTWVDVEGETVTCVFKRTGLGDYAASVFVDINGNGKLDTNAIGSPKEPWGVSQNAKARRFGPPLYKDAKFTYEGGAVTISIELVYDD